MSAPIALLPTSPPAALPDEVVAGQGLLRAEVFSRQQLERHARELAAWHRTGPNRGDRLLARLRENGEVLRSTLARLRAAKAIVPAGEWLLDNHHLIADEIATARRHLPRRYGRELPVLAVGDPEGMPRVYVLALELISHADGRVDLDNLQAFVAAYQEITPLGLGELWAMPIMLRLALLENLRRVAARVVAVQEERAAAATWSERVLRIAEESPSELVVAMAELAKGTRTSPGFVAELHRRLHGQHPSLVLVLQWLEQRLGERHQTMADLIRADNQDQAVDQVAVENAFTSLRRMDAIDWRAFVEALSPVEAALRDDPNGIYGRMDFATRDQYRHEIERLARRCRPSGAAAEIAVARRAIHLTGTRQHVGELLLGARRAELEADLAATCGLRRPSRRGIAPLAVGWYLAPIALLTLAGAAAAGWAGAAAGWGAGAWVLAILAVMPASQAALALVNWCATRLARPRRMPRLDLSAGIPPEFRSVVAVPALLRRPEDIAGLVDGLLVRQLANRDRELVFALLTDFGDAASETAPGDAELLDRAEEAVAEANRRHGGRFVLLHRPRRWDASEGAWIGRERKRGKLEDLNRLVLHGDRSPFLRIAGDADLLREVRFAIVLDCDTRLPRDAARELVAILAHPLVRPRIDPETRTVVAGHGILQPRVAIGLGSARATWYAALWSNDAGIDPYTRTVSDVYQDLFDAGSFIGKGIYDIAAVDVTLGGRFPDDTILSHDLIEGCYARAGLASDVLVVEDHPARYLGDIARRKRWIRGDWQLLPWLGDRVATSTGRERNVLGALARWKLLDNLRRSLVPASAVALLFAAWAFLPGIAATAVAVALLGTWCLPPALGILAGWRPAPEVPWRAHLHRLVSDTGQGLLAAAGELAFLPFSAAIALDAIARTLWRLAVSRRHLMEWQTAGDGERQAATSLAGVLAAMAIAPLCALGAAAIAWLRPETAATALPLAVLWLGAPLIAWRLSLPREHGPPEPSAQDRRWLLMQARRTWRFFAELVGPEDRHLAPDNFQELPVRAVAHRTSPTNIGLGLLADLAAHDLGFLTTAGLVERAGRTLSSVATLERFRGHLLNWYDTSTGRPLAPRYVSMVDSGNFAACLLVLAAGLRELRTCSPSASRRLAGAAATLACSGLPSADEAAAKAADLAALADVAAGLAALSEGESSAWCRQAAGEASAHLAELRAGGTPPELADRAEALAADAEAIALGMDWGFLLDPQAKLFAIGYQVDEARLDRSFYDLLASEARLGSFIAVACGGVVQEHWFRLGRQHVRTAGSQTLASWGGTMFEYLMPALLMPEDRGTLLGDAAGAAVAEQIRYGEARGVPWGISESAFHLTDAALNWQYRAFGVPGLGLKRGLGDDLVVAPYASALAILQDPRESIANLRRFETMGALGRYGFCEAVDFTTSRLPAGVGHAVIRSWMAHHQGMSLLAFAHLLDGARMRRRFLADPRLQAHRLLLQERPTAAAAEIEPAADAPERRDASEPSLRIVTDPLAMPPEVHLLSNGRYHVMVTAAGTGWSRWQDVAVTRWREDATSDGWGPCLWLRDRDSGQTWSATHHPTGRLGSSYEAVFTQARAEFRRSDHGILTHVEIAVSPEDDMELRRFNLTNRGDAPRRLEITTYAEPVLAPPAADLAHPAFANLFVETEALPDADAILATRRPRRPDEARRWLAHQLLVRDAEAGPLSWETDRARFIGRAHDLVHPQAMGGRPGPLEGSVGAVLDPALALRRSVVIPPGGRVTIDVVYAVAASRERVVELAHRYRDAHLADRVFGLSWTHGQVVLAQIGSSESEAQAFSRLAGSLVFASAHRRLPGEILRNRRPRSGLWSHGISGDLPICLLRVTDGARLDLVRQLLRAHAWWRSRGLGVDLVILVEDGSVYRQELCDRILGLVAASPSAGSVDHPGGVFVRRADLVPEEDRHLLAAAARMVITDSGGSLAQYAERRFRPDPVALPLVARRTRRDDPVLAPATYDLFAFNGIGGFTRDGREYIITLPPGRTTPLPWCNVLANSTLGTVVSERGSAYTWWGNCHEFRLTPWRCDPVGDPAGEAVYIRDEDAGYAWCPTPGPLPGRSTRVVRHGFGYSAFAAGEYGIASEMHMWVDPEAPLKFLRLRLANRSGRSRRLTATLWLEWTLGELRERTAAHLVTEQEDGVLFARNPMDDEAPQACAFAASSRRLVSWTCDRGEFLGHGGSSAHPQAMLAGKLLGRAGAALDPGAALQIQIDLDPGQEQEVSFVIGAAPDREQARRLAIAHRGLEAARGSLDRTYDHWKRLLGAVRVRTSDPELDVLANGWLAYQVIASRILARSGFSQSGGAWGFRDQLQDAMALVHHQPRLLREQLLRCAARQFRDGDVQHWWHPPRGRGVRTKISDDYLWLPLALARYLEAGGDAAVLDERSPFLEAQPLLAEEDSRYDLPAPSAENASLYDHAVRAILHGLRFGAHGIPLIGSGDWNDGMDRIGHHGRGESVWLGFFLVEVLRRFIPVARLRGDDAMVRRLADEAEALAGRIDATAWDGGWYLRAWSDEGTPFGGSGAAECSIDALPQAWAALTGACQPERARAAMDAVDRLLVRRNEGLVQLFDPPFDRGGLEPGYIKGYIPGVRENGGQYTHAAVWTAMGFAALGDGSRALGLAQLINPVRHGRDPGRWKAEPYVMAADVYRSPGHTGRAGWTWYTGSAGWMLRLILEALLGIERHGDRLRIAPGTPAGFGDFEVRYRVGTTTWVIAVRGDGAVRTVTCDGAAAADGLIPLIEDGREHRVEVRRS